MKKKNRNASSAPTADAETKIAGSARRARSLENRKRGPSRVVAAAAERVRRSRRTWSARASPGRRGQRPRDAWPVSVAGAGDGRRGLERSGRARRRVPRTGVVRARRTRIYLVAHSALLTSPSRTPSRSAIGAPGAVGKGHAPTKRACLSTRGSVRTTLRVAGDSLRARRRGRMAASAGGEGKRTIDRCASFRTYLTLKSLD